MSFFKPYCFTLLCAVLLAPACSTTPQPAVESPAVVAAAAPAAACDGAVFQGKCVHKGDIVTFGKYPQANETPEPIEWIMLDVVPKTENADGRILLLSKYVLDAKPYNTEDVSITWENSTLRTWLNGTFKTTAFTTSEQQQIAQTPLENPNNPYYGTNGGNATSDYVFLLSLADALSQTNDVAGSGKYFSSDTERKALATKYAVDNGLYESTPSGVTTCTNVQCSMPWWLRSPGHDTDIAAFVDGVGYVSDCFGYPVGYTGIGVRPALWVKY